MKVLKLIRLDINKQIYDNIIAKQGDSARYLLFRLLDNGVPFSLEGKVVRIYGSKPDGKKVFNNATVVDIKKGLVELQLTTQMLSVGGTLKLELTIYEGKEVFSTIPFEIEIIRSIRDDTAIESTNEFSALISGLLKLDEWDKLFKETSSKIEKKYTERLNRLDSQLSESKNLFFSILSTLLKNNRIRKIKLVGDSITEGVGATGHISPTPSSNPIIFDDGRTVFHEGDYQCRCWANLFREYIKKYYNTIEFINAGIGGKSAKWANANKEHWIKNEDVLFVQLGTNDRWDCSNVSEFKENLTQFLDYANKHSNYLIVMTAQPSLNDTKENGELATGFNFTQKEVDDVITQVCLENNYIHISNYRDMLNYSFNGGLPLWKMLEPFNKGSHPYDEGHLFIWENIQKKLGFMENVNKFKAVNTSNSVIEMPINSLTFHTHPTNINIFPYKNRFYVCEINGENPDINYFPQKEGGILEVYVSTGSLSNFMTFKKRQSNEVYYSYFIPSTQKWTDFDKGFPNFTSNLITTSSSINASTPISEYKTDSITIIKIPGSHADISNFPESKPGILYVNNLGNNGYSYREYQVYQSVNKYISFWREDNRGWDIWKKIQQATM